MSKITPSEKKTQLFSILFFLFGCLLVLGLQFTIGLYFTTHYFIAHFLFGLFFPYLFYSFAGNKLTYWIGFSLTLIWHLSHEFWEDQKTRSTYIVDFDQVVSGLIGLLVSFLIYRWWEKSVKPRFGAVYT